MLSLAVSYQVVTAGVCCAMYHNASWRTSTFDTSYRYRAVEMEVYDQFDH